MEQSINCCIRGNHFRPILIWCLHKWPELHSKHSCFLFYFSAIHLFWPKVFILSCTISFFRSALSLSLPSISNVSQIRQRQNKGLSQENKWVALKYWANTKIPNNLHLWFSIGCLQIKWGYMHHHRCLDITHAQS